MSLLTNHRLLGIHRLLQVATLLLGGGAECPLNHHPAAINFLFSRRNLTNLTKDALLRAHRASGVVTFSTTDYSDFTDFCKSLRSCEAAEPNALSTIIQQPSTFYSHANLATFRSLAEGESKSHEGCIATRASASGMVTFSTTDDTDFTDCCKSLRSC